MAESQQLLMVEFLSWVADRPRTYDEAMAAWQSQCPRQTIWEDAMIDGLIEVEQQAFQHRVVLTERGQALLGAQTNLCQQPGKKIAVAG
jgi:hypothetical protein